MAIQMKPSKGIFVCSIKKVAHLPPEGIGGKNTPGSVILNRNRSQIKSNKKERT